jgi:signal transduction histidine kinase
MNILLYFSLSGLIIGVTSFFLAVYVYLNNRNSIVNRTFARFAFYVGIWAFAYIFWPLAKDKEQCLFAFRMLHLGAIFIPVGFYHFVLAFLGKENRRSVIFAYGTAAFFLMFSFSGLYIKDMSPRMFFPYWGIPGPLYPFFLLMFFGYAGYSLYLLFRGYAQTANNKRKAQILCIGVGTLIGFIGGGSNYLLWYDILVPPYINILVEVYIVLTAYTIIRHNFLDIRVIIKKTIVFAGLFVFSYSVVASFAYLSSLFFENIVSSKWVAFVPSILIIVLMLRPVENFLRSATDKYLFQKKYDYKHLLKTFSEEVLSVLDLEMLVNLTVNKLVEIMKLENASIFLCGEDESVSRIVACAGNIDPERQLSAREDLISYMQKRGGYVLRSAIHDKNIRDSASDAGIGHLKANLIIPLIHHKSMVGVLTLGGKKSDEDFTQDDIDILLPLAKTFSIAVTNARLFEQLSEAQAQAAQREKMAVIGTLSAGINHEICNPLGIARGQCEMFLLNLEEGIYRDKSRDELLEKAKVIMQKVIKETDRATVITRKLSSFAKPAKGNIETGIKVTEELMEVISLVEHDLKLDNISVVCEFQEEIPAVEADRKQVQEIFFNIIKNAAQAISHGGRITIKAFSSAESVCVKVEDSGEGMDKGVLQKIFDPFFTTKEPNKGTGLGLFIVKQIVERNNGRIYVESETGEGSVFTVEFPAASAVGMAGK